MGYLLLELKVIIIEENRGAKFYDPTLGNSLLLWHV